MPEIGTSGSMSGERKRSDAERPKPPRPFLQMLRSARRDESAGDWSMLEEVIAEEPELYRSLIVV